MQAQNTTAAQPQADGDSRPIGVLRLTPAPRRVSPVVIDGLAAILSKTRSIQRGEPLSAWAGVSPETQQELVLEATAAVNAQDLSKRRKAHDLALERAERVILEEGAIASDQARSLARRIAAEALLTHQLALQGAFEQGGAL